VPEDLFNREAMSLRHSYGLPLIDGVNRRNQGECRQREEFLRRTFQQVASSTTPKKRTWGVGIIPFHPCSLERCPDGGYIISGVPSKKFATAFVDEIEAEYLGNDGDEESEPDWEQYAPSARGEFLCPRVFSAFFKKVKLPKIKILRIL
jgi:hypothetical protein